ncbi:thiamine pyrophosphate-dependent enzyme [Pseudarthrobacter albicanus]|uniref:thiamine pyrophosphate-dependent enzyme n=1 Tax=Pseudarthrobacter albicanus TaxID=2823873 RepID=UPI001FE7FAAA|nr:thiamine pyrophosphate-dependent enzyme [Pseudarthrobacter albicanus]
MEKKTHAGQAIVDSLALHGVDRVFAVPGESYLAVLDGLHGADIETIVCRQEGGAAYMAEAHGKFTGEPGVAMVTRGPGAANAFVAIHAAWQDATPMVLFVGLIPVADRQRESFQEFDPNAWFGTQAKRVFVLEEASRASEVVAEAFFAAKSGRPGPVIVGLPEDVITHEFTGALHPVLTVAEGAVSAAELELITTALARAEKPVIFAGGPRWTPESAAAVTRFAETNGIPVIQDWRASDRIPFGSEVYAGALGYGRTQETVRMFADADVLLAIGALPTDVPTDGYKIRQSMDATNIVVNIDTTLRGRSGAVTAHILASPVAFADAVKDVQLGKAAQWDAWRAAGRTAQAAFSALPDLATLPATREGTGHMSAVIAELVRRLPKDAVYSFGAGNHCAWAQTYLPTNVFPSQLSMRNGSMGYSVPAAVAASLQSPGRLAVAVAGDGEFLMNGQEFATAVQYGAAMLIIVMDNGQYGTIRDHQEHHFPGRVSGTQLSNPDFAAFARAFGGHGETVTNDGDAAIAVERALKAVRDQRIPAIIHVVTDPQIALP